jgi:hypothetical protein
MPNHSSAFACRAEDGDQCTGDEWLARAGVATRRFTNHLLDFIIFIATLHVCAVL